MPETLLQILLDKYKAGVLTGEEKIQLAELIKMPERRAELEDIIDRDFSDTALVSRGDLDTMELIYQQITSEMSEIVETPVVPMNIPVKRPGKLKWATAAAILVLLAAGSYFALRPAKENLAKSENLNHKADDIAAPTASKATLTLANGKRIALDSVASGSLAVQANTNVIKAADGQISYHAVGISKEIQYNTLSVPRGSNVATITLSDNTKVWLNSGSSLSYPVAFMGRERNVEISGEGYFEVAKNALMPFTVKRMNSDTRVRVLGTHFNVNMYEDENTAKVTLLEGSVKVMQGATTKLLVPGQQAQIKSSEISLAADVDMEAVMAWKNGQFLLKGADLAMLMRQVARWYDVDIEYQGKISEKKFGGSIGRNVSLSTVIEALKQNGVNTELEGRKLIIKEK